MGDGAVWQPSPSPSPPNDSAPSVDDVRIVAQKRTRTTPPSRLRYPPSPTPSTSLALGVATAVAELRHALFERGEDLVGGVVRDVRIGGDERGLLGLADILFGVGDLVLDLLLVGLGGSLELLAEVADLRARGVHAFVTKSLHERGVALRALFGADAGDFLGQETATVTRAARIALGALLAIGAGNLTLGVGVTRGAGDTRRTLGGRSRGGRGLAVIHHEVRGGGTKGGGEDQGQDVLHRGWN